MFTVATFAEHPTLDLNTAQVTTPRYLRSDGWLPSLCVEHRPPSLRQTEQLCSTVVVRG